MTCPRCGSPVEPGAAFCGVCTEVLVKRAPRAAEWTPGTLLAAAALAALFIPFREKILDWTWPVDGVNLAFHEGGHIVFGILGLGNRFVMVLGGTAMQLLIPLACALRFRRGGQRASASACLIWLGQNLLGIGKYAADARAQELPLVAGGVHDWTYLLEVFGVLIHDVGIGRGVQVLGCLIMAAAIAGVWVYAPRERSGG